MARARIAVLISGRGSNMAALIYAAKADDCPFEIAAVLSNNADADGLKLAAAEDIPTAALPPGLKAFVAAAEPLLAEHRVTHIALAGFMRILPPDFVARWEGRMLNIHPSLLPSYKGLDTHARVLAARDAHAGCSVHLVTAELDDGDVLAQTEVAILPGDTPETLAARVLIAEHQLYPRTLAAYVSRETDPAWIVTHLGELALALPETSFRTAHGSPAWRVGGDSGKFFAIVFNRHHGEDSVGVLVKTSGQDEMADLIDADPGLYFRPAYYGPAGWIGLRLDRANVDWDQVGDWLARSWRACAPKRLTKLIDAADAF
jgi:phosphoribosylglycinamide formyltransferase 1